MAEVKALEKNPNWKGRRGPVVLVFMDGVGYGKFEEGDAVRASKMKYLDWFTANCQYPQHGRLLPKNQYQNPPSGSQ